MILRLNTSIGSWIYDNFKRIHHCQGIITITHEKGGPTGDNPVINDEIYQGTIHEIQGGDLNSREVFYADNPPTAICNMDNFTLQAWGDEHFIEKFDFLKCYIVWAIPRDTSGCDIFLIAEGASGYIMNDDGKTIEILR